MKTSDKIFLEIQGVLSQIKEENLQEIATKLVDAKRIFVIGEGRSGFMGKSFAMRLMHLNANVFSVGETITPSIAEGDILLAVSGSGTTKSVVWTAEKAKELNCQVIAVTTNSESPLAAASSDVLHIPAATKYRADGEIQSVQPLGSLFDQSVHIVFDSICLIYSNLKEYGHNEAFSRHSNLE
ncbi:MULTISPECIES: 6-phospho-3-hexuloisomerase [Metabacillus]|uniref:6-phospho 3-hexuloisomerase n=2 Tax=Metabacillus TaxID=2675233 RepID=A0A179T669_9BACI|nr:MULTISPECIES: 6-phospho-3-hexuloisomerase [Metabacillus]OAS89497.1 6-phospho 3-hexuloisomerase [Metabacillus litoralis]QNF29019.1 6-phospho-3-hexuloisomerase [Metabacillus sp. KUDC1714]